MFLTSTDSRHQRASAFFPGHHVWHRVQLPLANPLVIWRTAHPLENKQEQEYSTYISETGNFAAMASAPHVHVLCADLLLPPEVSASARWEVHEVRELWECEEPDNSEIHCCVLRTAHLDHSDSVCGTPATELKKRKLLYEFKREGDRPSKRAAT